MGYYERRRYRSWRSRGWHGSSAPSKYSILVGLLGNAVSAIYQHFINMDEDAIDELLADYGAIYGASAEKYARNTFPKWKSGATKLSGQTMERLIELVPPYLSPDQRFSVLQIVIKKYKKSGVYRTVRINIKEPAQGFSELEQALTSMSHDDVLAHLPEKVMEAAKWLYDDDITSARAMLAEAERVENDLVRSKAAREMELLRRTISTGQVKAATYSVTMPSGTLSVTAFTPSKCFVATVCFGQTAPETIILRKWRDDFLLNRLWGRKFVVWYYNNGERLSILVNRYKFLKYVTKTLISGLLKIIPHLKIR